MRRMGFNRVFKRFQWSTIRIKDVLGKYVEGVWVEDIDTEIFREIRAIPLLDSRQDLDINSSGEYSSAILTLTTASRLFWTDVTYDLVSSFQSYVYWKDFLWRVIGVNHMLGNSEKYQIYTAERHIR